MGKGAERLGENDRAILRPVGGFKGLQIEMVEDGEVGVSHRVAEHYHGPLVFERLVHFRNQLEGLRGFVPESERWSKDNHPDYVDILAWRNSEASRLVEQITDLANRKTTPTKDPELRREYQKAVGEVLRLVREERVGNPSLAIVPLRAGLFAAEELGYQRERQFWVEAKRLPFKDGGMAFGLVHKEQDPERKRSSANGGSIAFSEVCLATGSTIVGILADLSHREQRPREALIEAVAITQQGATFVRTVAEAVGIELRIRAGEVFYGMNDIYYILADDNRYAVGDAGDFTALQAGDVLKRGNRIYVILGGYEAVEGSYLLVQSPQSRVPEKWDARFLHRDMGFERILDIP